MDREARNAMLASVVRTIRDERHTAWPEMPALRQECESALSRTAFDHDSALAILRGEDVADDDPWERCPSCDCDTYFRSSLRFAVRDDSGTEMELPVTSSVCEGCRYTEFRASASVERGSWWTEGTRVRAQAAAAHPYRGEDVVVDDPSVDAKQPDEPPTDDVWTERRTCSDGACIGLVGADGRCKVCGRTDAA